MGSSEIIQRTNCGLERYNRYFHERFPKNCKPTLLQFAQEIRNQESEIKNQIINFQTTGTKWERPSIFGSKDAKESKRALALRNKFDQLQIEKQSHSIAAATSSVSSSSKISSSSTTSSNVLMEISTSARKRSPPFLQQTSAYNKKLKKQPPKKRKKSQKLTSDSDDEPEFFAYSSDIFFQIS